jgi:hypothetical protein
VPLSSCCKAKIARWRASSRRKHRRALPLDCRSYGEASAGRSRTGYGRIFAFRHDPS